MVRQPWYFSIVYKLAKPFLKQKFKDRVSEAVGVCDRLSVSCDHLSVSCDRLSVSCDCLSILHCCRSTCTAQTWSLCTSTSLSPSCRQTLAGPCLPSPPPPSGNYWTPLALALALLLLQAAESRLLVAQGPVLPPAYTTLTLHNIIMSYLWFYIAPLILIMCIYMCVHVCICVSVVIYDRSPVCFHLTPFPAD